MTATTTDRGPGSGEQLDHVDVLIVGAGLTGIGAACRLVEERPGTSFAIFEARDAIGGTWDLFRYPGVRSDSDMFTLGYPFRPWPEARAIAEAIPQGGRYLYDRTFAFIDAMALAAGVGKDRVLPFAGSSDPLHRAVLAFTGPTKSYVVAEPGY